MSVERYLLINLLMDGLLLGIAADSCGVMNPHRLGLSALLATGVGLAPICLGGLSVARLLGALLLPGLCVLIAGRPDARLSLTIGLMLAVGSAVVAGCALLLGPHRRAAGLTIGLMLWGSLMRLRCPARRIWEITVCVSENGRIARFTAMIDTGNRLREPRSRQSVLLAEAALLKDVLPGSGYRRVPYGSIGAQGSLECFHPNGLWVERGRRRSPIRDVWVGVVPGRLPGSARALAPCEFAVMKW